MRPGSQPLTVVRRCAIALVLAVALLAIGVPTATAAPPTDERRQVATEVAQSFCQKIMDIPLLPTSVDAQAVCTSVLVENLDPEGNNSGLRAACVAVLPVGASTVTEACVKVMDAILDPARAVFLDRVVPAAQQLACVTSAPAAFDCLAQQVHVWLTQSISSLWQGLLSVLTADTKAIQIIDGWQNPGIVSLYQDIGALAATLLLGLMIVSLIVSVIKFDFRQFGSTLVGVVMWGIFWAAGVTIAVLLLKASDGAATWLAGQPDASGNSDLDRAGQAFGTWVDYVTGTTAGKTASVHPTYDQGSFTAILICLLLIVTIVIALIALLLRNVAVLLLIVLFPITLAGGSGPKMTQGWLVAAFRMFIALLLAKPLIIVAVRLGAVLVSVPRQGEAQATFSDALLGVAIILLAGLLPGVIYRFSGGLMHSSAGAAPRTSGGVSEQSAISAQTSFDTTRMIMERNVMRPQSAIGPGGPVATSTSGPAGGLRGLGTTTSGAAGPVGLALAGTALVGGALESGGRWTAGQAATAGGVLGDVEAPRVPSPPISRPGQYGPPVTPRVTGQTPRAGQVGEPGSTVHLTLTQTPAVSNQAPVLPQGQPALTIPGTVEPEPGRAELPAAPKALPRGSDQ